MGPCSILRWVDSSVKKDAFAKVLVGRMLRLCNEFSISPEKSTRRRWVCHISNNTGTCHTDCQVNQFHYFRLKFSRNRWSRAKFTGGLRLCRVDWQHLWPFLFEEGPVNGISNFDMQIIWLFPLVTAGGLRFPGELLP